MGQQQPIMSTSNSRHRPSPAAAARSRRRSAVARTRRRGRAQVLGASDRSSGLWTGYSLSGASSCCPKARLGCPPFRGARTTSGGFGQVVHCPESPVVVRRLDLVARRSGGLGQRVEASDRLFIVWSLQLLSEGPTWLPAVPGGSDNEWRLRTGYSLSGAPSCCPKARLGCPPIRGARTTSGGFGQVIRCPTTRVLGRCPQFLSEPPPSPASPPTSPPSHQPHRRATDLAGEPPTSLPRPHSLGGGRKSWPNVLVSSLSTRLARIVAFDGSRRTAYVGCSALPVVSRR
jgi:hypothetical protein